MKYRVKKKASDIHTSDIHTVQEARARAYRRLPRAVFDYLDGAAEGERTMRANLAAFDALQFRPRMAVTTGTAPDICTTVLGIPVSLPVLISPIGSTRMMHVDGDLAAARAAGSAGTILTVSTMSGHRIAEVADAAMGPLWFQLYFLGGRKGAETLVDRARIAGYQALVVTLDTPSPGPRERELRTGLRPPIQLDIRTVKKMAWQVAIRPRWLVAAARDRFDLTRIANVSYLGDPAGSITATDAIEAWWAAPAQWEDLAWLRDQFGGPVIVKGILSGEDAKKAIDCGASAIIVSNHGGRQLDRAPATLPALVDVLAAVGNEVEVYVDGGLRRGSDVVAAIALGARAAMIGRPWAYGLSAAGESGVMDIINIFRTGIERTLRLLGCGSLDALNGEFLRIPADW